MTFEVWAGTSYGDTTSPEATLCDGRAYDAAHEPKPYTVYCKLSD